ncbi:MAG TPA: carbohydrate kinase [Beutenbergiaceae bacterium]|nr:carbohydrate kinase [Beutenbergiaceae bacterium]
MTRALVIGEALVDVVHAADGTVTEHPGGSPANVALGLARLGRTTTLVTWLGQDPAGDLVRSHLQDSGVQLLAGSDLAERTSSAVAHLDHQGAATYTFDLDWQVPDTDLTADVTAVHVGSIAATLPPGATDVAALVHAARPQATISYDPNTRPSIMGTPEQARVVIEALVGAADIVKVSDEDIAWLHPGQDVVDIAGRWAGSGPALVVLTRGGQGAIGLTSGGLRIEVPSPNVQVADTVGAGDSYMAGLLDGLWAAGLLGAGQRAALHSTGAKTVRTAMQHAAQVAAITVSRPGADPPGRDDLPGAAARTKEGSP